MNNEWKDWCRLCAKPSTSGVLSIFENSSFERIKKYLSISVNNEDDLPQTVCQACSQRITSFDSFAEHCIRVQAMFCAISEQSDDIIDRLDFIRSKYLQEEPKVLSERNKESSLPSNVSEPFLSTNGIPALRTILKLKTTRKTIPRTKVPTRKTPLKHIATKIKLEDPERRSSRLQELAQTQVDFSGEGVLGVKVESENVESKEELPKKRGRPPKRIVGVVKRKMKSPKVVKFKKSLIIEDGFDEMGMEVKPLNEKVSQPSIFQWKCHVCGEIARNWNSLSIHTRRAHDVPAQVLCLCAKVLTSRASIIKHRLKHTDGYKYKCEKCSKSFHRRGCYELHVLSHVPKEEQPFVCCKCARRFHCESLLRQHEKVHLPKEERLIFPCTTCQKKFSSKSAVSAHIKSIHFGERPFVCDQCGHSFTSKGILQEHLTIHSDETPFKCQHCFKSFKTKYRLKIHLDIHREMPYQCPICPLQLSTRRTLRMHLVVHRETKAFQCSTCGKAFRRAKDLKNHHNLHTGRRPYTCTFCPRTFANGSNCRSHKRRMHPDELRAYEAALLANDPAAAAAAAAGSGSAARPEVLGQVDVPVSRPVESEEEYRRHASFSECNETSMKTLLGLHSARPYAGNEAVDSTTHPHAVCSQVGQVPNDHDPLRNGHHYSTPMADVSTCNVGRSTIDDSRRIHGALDGRPDHVLSMTPLNLNISELHVGRHHMANGLDQGDRRMDSFHVQRTHMAGLNQGLEAAANEQHLRQHQGFVVDGNRQVRNEMVVQQNTDQQNILQGYPSMNHTLYQQHSGGIGVPAFPGNPYVQHGMASSLANYQRGSRNM